jgi:hypothetical protein
VASPRQSNRRDIQGPPMVTTGKIGEVGRDSKGHWRPGYMTHAELVSELETATGNRRAALATEAKSPMKRTAYPPFTERLGPEGPE